MGRLFENAASLRREKEFADHIASVYKVEAQKIKGHAELDYRFVRNGKILLYSELKCRNNPRLRYPTYKISTNKIERGLEVSKKTGVPFALFIRWTDADGFLQVKQIDPRWEIRQEWHDERLHMDELIYIPIQLFEVLKK